MKMTSRGIASLLLAGAIALAGVLPATAAGFFTFPPAGGSQYPNTVPITGNETIPADTNLASGLNPATEVISTNQLSGYIGSSLNSWRNALIGGDFNTNLWQRGTTSASITTSITYTADRWWGLSGTGTAFTVIKQTGASDITTGVLATARVQRTAAQSGVLPICVGQAVITANSLAFQGKTAEFSFFAKVGANFSAASNNVTATISYGTGTDGSAANQSTGGWTGFANATATTVTLSTGFVRYSVVGAIPATANQVGVKICYTPVGTAGANDWFEFGNAQLAVNAAAVAATTPTDSNYSILAFDYRNALVETELQQAYYFQLTESAAITPIATCVSVDTTHTNCLIPTQVTMRTTPTATYTAGFATPTTTSQATLGACSVLATAQTVASAVSNPNAVLVNCTATTIPAAGTPSFLYSNGGSGKINITAEL